MDAANYRPWNELQGMNSADKMAASKMLLILLSMAFGLSVFVLISALHGAKGEINPLLVGVWVIFTGSSLVGWRKLAFSGRRWLALLFLAFLAGRWIHAWLFAEGADIATGILVGVLYTPIVLMISILMWSGQTYPLGCIAGSVMGLVPLLGSHREAVSALPFADWRLGLLVFFMLSLFGAFVDIWVRERRQLLSALIKGKELDRISRTDPLTGVWNRRGAEIGLAEFASQDKSFAVFVCDIDHFKSINDRFGHAQGDRVLVTVAAALSAIIRPDDMVARWGGEEFLVALPEVTPRKARRIADKMRWNVAKRTQRHSFPVTITIGVAVSRPDEELVSLLERADRALYRGKAGGRNITVLAP